jgi:DNA-binding CsgD family transcriptional regulator
MREGFIYGSDSHPRLQSLWLELTAKKSWITVAVEDRRRPEGRRLVGFGASVFVTDAFAQHALKGQPFLSRAFLEKWETGERPYLSRDEVAQANAGGGLNLMILHYGWDPELSLEDLQRIQLLQTERFIHQHAGYRTKEYLQEAFGPELLDFLLKAGSSLRHDYRGARWRRSVGGVRAQDRPALVGFRPEEMKDQSGTAAAMMQARAVPPRFGLAPSEQEMLVGALESKTDEELASTLDLSPWTVKKRWQAVYLKVKKADPDLLEARNGMDGTEEGHNRQRRRYLLDYLRHHPEELRPRTHPKNR